MDYGEQEILKDAVEISGFDDEENAANKILEGANSESKQASLGGLDSATKDERVGAISDYAEAAAS